MSYRTNTDNIYQTGSTITAKENPGVNLVIVKYYQRIYYCVPESDTNAKQHAYYERELIAPPVAKEGLW